MSSDKQRIPPESIVPEIVKSRFKNASRNQTTTQKKKIMCVVINEPDNIQDSGNNAMPRVIAKPVKVKYGQLFFRANDKKYWIIYDLLKDFGKHFLYMTTENNSVGGIKFDTHNEYASPSQVDMMLDEHTVETFKRNKIKLLQKLILIVGIAMLISMVALMITVQYIIGQSNAMSRLQIQNNNLAIENNNMKIQLGILPPPVVTK